VLPDKEPFWYYLHSNDFPSNEISAWTFTELTWLFFREVCMFWKLSHLNFRYSEDWVLENDLQKYFQGWKKLLTCVYVVSRRTLSRQFNDISFCRKVPLFICLISYFSDMKVNIVTEGYWHLFSENQSTYWIVWPHIPIPHNLRAVYKLQQWVYA
jgi:hypothetical protein